MKKTFLLIVLCLVVSACKKDALSKIDESKVMAASIRDQSSTKFPVLQFSKVEHDFGEIINGTAVETTFKYKNIGESPLVISDIKSSCGCTIPKNWSRAALAPGLEGEFTVKFNGKGNNKISKTVTITANTEKGKELVKISAFVIPDPNAIAVAKPLSPVVK